MRCLPSEEMLTRVMVVDVDLDQSDLGDMVAESTYFILRDSPIACD